MTNISPTYRSVRDFMVKAKQATPTKAVYPDAKTRALRARLILEEALETVEALGCSVKVLRTTPDGCIAADSDLEITPRTGTALPPLLDEDMLCSVADGVADIIYVSLGTLAACGIPDIPVMEEVVASNDSKFLEGHSFRPDGKLQKSPLYKPVDMVPAVAAGVIL